MQKKLLSLIHNHQNAQVTTCEHLLQIQQQLNNKNIQLSPFYRVQGYIVTIQPQSLDEALKYICLYCKQSYSYDLDMILCCQKETKLSLQCYIALRDQSLSQTKNFLEICLLNYDNNPEEFFPGINRASLQIKEKHELIQNQYLEIIKKMSQIGDDDQQYDFVLEPMKYSDRLKYRIIDTSIKPEIMQMSIF